jgi:hypothetical protein
MRQKLDIYLQKIKKFARDRLGLFFNLKCFWGATGFHIEKMCAAAYRLFLS